MQRTQEELQRQLAQLGWTIGQEDRQYDEIIPLRQLASVILREESLPTQENLPTKADSKGKRKLQAGSGVKPKQRKRI
ncbi:hypothetical protein ACLKA6_014118 [Drosophila palustris]